MNYERKSHRAGKNSSYARLLSREQVNRRDDTQHDRENRKPFV